jgi:hypothetical protein
MQAIALAPQRGAEDWILALEATVDGRMVDVTATRSGRIDHVLVAEGEQVGKDGRLIELDHVVSGSPPVRVIIRAPVRGGSVSLPREILLRLRRTGHAGARGQNGTYPTYRLGLQRADSSSRALPERSRASRKPTSQVPSF